MLDLLSLRRGLLLAASATAFTAAGAASASDAPSSDTTSIDLATLTGAGAEDAPAIITRDDIDPDLDPPLGSLDLTGINGIGQMIAESPEGGFGLCTGSLINPRTVLFAAHCVNDVPQDAYGSNTGGLGLAFAFQDQTLASLQAWIRNGFQTIEDQAIYNVEHLWYDERSLNGVFLQADVAIATLDTPAFDIPTWAMLFTPLDQQESVAITGYGGRGTNLSGSLGIDFRRRAAENFVSFLGSRRDINAFLFGSSTTFPQNLYFTAFNDPNADYNPGEGRFDFGIFGEDDIALTFEGTTAGGDSGGPLILDEKYEIPLILGVLSGGTRFFTAQGFDAYGTLSFYQPLHAYWQVIVANNPYVYATNKDGAGEWTDPDHWIQAMDPNYFVGVDGELINRLPSSPGGENTGAGARFGDVCFLTNCVDFDRDPIVTVTDDQFFVEGGPGSENFVPNNITGDPTIGQRPRYFDVTLGTGVTTLSGADITIDKFALDGAAFFDMAADASLESLGDFTQLSGWSNIDGRMIAGETFLLSGFLTGSGTLRTPFLTSLSATIAPGGLNSVGTLTIDGNAILASASNLFINTTRNGADLLTVTGNLSLSDPNDANAPGATLVLGAQRGRGGGPRFGQSFTIALAGGGVSGEFGTVVSTLGVLRPELTYNDNTVVVSMAANSLAQMVGTRNRSARAVGSALDDLRGGSYDDLYNLYGVVDLMDGAMLADTLASLVPDMNSFGVQMQEQQSRALFGTVTDRLSSLSGGPGGSMDVIGSPSALGMFASGQQIDERASFAGLVPSGAQSAPLPEGVSGFVAGGTTANGAASGLGTVDGARSTYFAMGLEKAVERDLTVGLSVGYADGISQFSGQTVDSRMTQVAAYGAYDLGHGGYVGLAGSLEQVEADTQRDNVGGQMFGAHDTTRLSLVAETGVNLPVSNGLTFTPRIQLGYNDSALSGMTEAGGDAALTLDDMRIARIDARFGAKLSGSEHVGNGWQFTPQLSADYVRMVDGSDDGMTVRFAAADSVAIALPFAFGDEEWSEIRGGFQFEKGGVSFGAGFETAIGREMLRADRAVANVNLRF